jgi:hypothetical protein
MSSRDRNPLAKQVRAIRRALTAIDRSLARLFAATKRGGRGASVKRVPPRRKLKLSPKRRAELKLQGQYMGSLRKLKPRQRAQVKALREKKGTKAAIAMAKRFVAGRG